MTNRVQGDVAGYRVDCRVNFMGRSNIIIIGTDVIALGPLTNCAVDRNRYFQWTQ